MHVRDGISQPPITYRIIIDFPLEQRGRNGSVERAVRLQRFADRVERLRAAYRWIDGRYHCTTFRCPPQIRHTHTHTSKSHISPSSTSMYDHKAAAVAAATTTTTTVQDWQKQKEKRANRVTVCSSSFDLCDGVGHELDIIMCGSVLVG